MKKTAKILAILLAVLLGATAMASLLAYADNAIPPDTGTLTIHKYVMKDLTQANDPNDGREIGDPEDDPQDPTYDYGTTIPDGAVP